MDTTKRDSAKQRKAKSIPVDSLLFPQLYRIMTAIYKRITSNFDALYTLWEHEKIHRKISFLLVIFFLVSASAIELKRQGLLPDSFAEMIPYSHFSAVQAAFTVVLILEVISLIFTIPCSFSRSVGKQFEILALILMRNAFLF